MQYLLVHHGDNYPSMAVPLFPMFQPYGNMLEWWSRRGKCAFSFWKQCSSPCSEGKICNCNELDTILSFVTEIGNEASCNFKNDRGQNCQHHQNQRVIIQTKRIQSSQIHYVGAKSIELFRGVCHCDYRDVALHERLLYQLAGSLVEGACTFIKQQNTWLQ